VIKMANIKNNNYRKIDCNLINDMYMDFMISKEDINKQNINDVSFATKINFNNIKNDCKYVVSSVEWDKASASNTILKNIGYTGIDNGFIKYEYGKDDLTSILTNSSFDLSMHNKYFFITEVNGNTNKFSYEIEKNDEYVSLKGGFFQGFFKIDGDNYQTLPHEIENEWNFNFTLRKQNYKTNENILNKYNENNSGIFFFIGTRSENKFEPIYKQKKYIELTDSNGNPINENGFYSIDTDNKFIIFNRTKNGFTKKTWNDDEYDFKLTGKTVDENINYFTQFNQTKTGYTINNIKELNNNTNIELNTLEDIEFNALALIINENGSIGYRYMINDGNIIEEYSSNNIIKYSEWTNIHLKIVKLQSSNNECSNNIRQCKMKLYIYVNGNLKLISKELPELKLKPLNDNSERQEGVPYNLSIGGGSQGLCDSVYPIDLENDSIPSIIEHYFAGTFIGDIKNFSFIPQHLNYSLISENLNGFQ
jgi:hypothetical protein